MTARLHRKDKTTRHGKTHREGADTPLLVEARAVHTKKDMNECAHTHTCVCVRSIRLLLLRLSECCARLTVGGQHAPCLICDERVPGRNYRALQMAMTTVPRTRVATDAFASSGAGTHKHTRPHIMAQGNGIKNLHGDAAKCALEENGPTPPRVRMCPGSGGDFIECSHVLMTETRMGGPRWEGEEMMKRRMWVLVSVWYEAAGPCMVPDRTGPSQKAI